MKKIISLFLEIFLITNIFALEKTIKLNSGYEMPILGLGTWTLTGETCEVAVYSALKDGYRLIDTAKYYGNEKEVGNGIAKAVKEGICKREEVFITTKIVPWSSNPEKDIKDSLKQLGVEYIDLCLLHQSGGQTSDDRVYKAMEKYAKAHGKTAAQIIVRWHLQSGYIAIPGSSNPAHILENYSVWDFELNDEEMKEIKAINRNKRYENW